ncbi:hypothetical protein LS71_002795 [Helicobacter jaachi]|uniref:Phage tail protein n=1 Tax=Helicobacter jaachi TaxID=1677920 RepID=A0A4U8TCL1_9HELI|nr:hypothetical protein [Helicobacter jaachi]TLD97685.1 hypothetical protein LS71_002795 [Helicobacter jaachi]
MGLEQYIAPLWRVSLNGKKSHNLNITQVRYSDFEKDNIDTLCLELAPNATPPNFGDRIELFMGRNALYFFGAFYVSAIKEQYKRGFSIDCTSIDYTKGFKVKKSRTFEGSIADCIRSIARENNLKTKLDFRYAQSIEVIEQVDESDSALLHRLADELFCTCKVSNDTLIFLDKGKEFDRRTYAINADECISLDIETFAATRYKSIELTYTDSEGNARSVKVGSGEPLYKLHRFAKDDTHALQMATTKLETLNSKHIKGSLSAVGRVLFAGGYLNLTFKGKISRHTITQVTHSLDSSAWNMELNFE